MEPTKDYSFVDYSNDCFQPVAVDQVNLEQSNQNSVWKLSDDEMDCLAVIHSNDTMQFHRTHLPFEFVRAFKAMERGEPRALLNYEERGTNLCTIDFLRDCVQPESNFRKLIQIFQKADLKEFQFDQILSKDLEFFGNEFEDVCFGTQTQITGRGLAETLIDTLDRIKEHLG